MLDSSDLGAAVRPGEFAGHARPLFGSTGALHREQVRGATVPIAAQPGDRLELVRIDPAILVEHGVIDVDRHDLADHQIRRHRAVAHWHDLAEAAFQMGGGLGDAGRLHDQGGQEGEVRQVGLALAVSDLG